MRLMLKVIALPLLAIGVIGLIVASRIVAWLDRPTTSPERVRRAGL